jgi:hypothetical protein
MACCSWNPVSLNDPQPYYPEYKIPPKAELEKMDWEEFNKWREKAKRLLLAFFQKKWRYKGFSDAQEDELQDMYRAARESIFGSKRYGCHFYGKKKWDLNIDVQGSWETNKPDWYPKE